jgi:hypothetical protein
LRIRHVGEEAAGINDWSANIIALEKKKTDVVVMGF